LKPRLLGGLIHSSAENEDMGKTRCSLFSNSRKNPPIRASTQLTVWALTQRPYSQEGKVIGGGEIVESLGGAVGPSRQRIDEMSRLGIPTLQQFSTMEKMAVIVGPAPILPRCNQIRRQMEIGRIESSALLVLALSSRHFGNRDSFCHRDRVSSPARLVRILGSAFLCIASVSKVASPAGEEPSPCAATDPTAMYRSRHPVVFRQGIRWSGCRCRASASNHATTRSIKVLAK